MAESVASVATSLIMEAVQILHRDELASLASLALACHGKHDKLITLVRLQKNISHFNYNETQIQQQHRII